MVAIDSVFVPETQRHTWTMLLVDDDDADVALFHSWMQRADRPWEIRRATSMREAVVELDREPAPDLIVCGLALPDVSGMQAVRSLVSASSGIPMIVLSGSNRSDVAERALRLGVEDCISREEMSEDVVRRAIRFALTRHKAQRRLAALEASLQQADSELDDYAHMVAHDLRAPLRTSRLFAEEIAHQLDGSDEDVAAMSRHLNETLGQLDRLILSMLDYAGLRGSIPIPEPVLCEPVIEFVLGQVSSDLADARPEVRLDIESSASVLATRELLIRILCNLVTNAIKFRSPHRRLELDIDTVTRERTLQIRVADNGVGVPFNQRERIFEPLERLDPSVDGTGFGLAICRRMARSIGGDVWVESAEGPGTVMVVELLRPTDRYRTAPASVFDWPGPASM